MMLVADGSVRFESRSAACEMLRSEETVRWAENFFARPRAPLPEIVLMSAEGSTLRAFHTNKFGPPPSVLYREWAQEYFEGRSSRFLGAREQRQLTDLIHEATEDMIESWRRRAPGYDLTFGRAAKLVNLMLKHLVLYQHAKETERRRLWSHLHVALDRFTLRPLAQLAPELGIPRSASMGAVNGPAEYAAIQDWIADLCADAGVPPISWEVLTFHMPKGIWEGGPQPDLPLSDVRLTAKHTPQAMETGRQPSASTPGSGPRVDRFAEVQSLRAVTAARVVHATRAIYRGAVFSGALELAGGDGAASVPPTENQTFKCRLRWHGWEPQTGYARVAVGAGWRIEEAYTGNVVEEVGRPNAIRSKEKGRREPA